MSSEYDGLLLRQADAGFERARLAAIWNARTTSRRPAAVLLAGSVEDVQRGVRLAAREGWQVGIRSGGHSWIATGVREDALLIDLSGLDSVSVDRAARRAVVQPGVRGSALNIMLASAGLAFPAGHCSTVCVGGYLISGGYGWNSRTLGPACLSIEAVDVVLADGSLVHADDESHPELMWAVRGSGPGFFGVVVAFHLRLYPGYERILVSTVTVGAELREEALAWSSDALARMPLGLEVVGETRPAGLGGLGGQSGSAPTETTLVATGFVGGVGREGADELYEVFESAPFRGDAVECVDRVEVDFGGMYSVLDTKMPEGRRFAVDGVWTDAPAAAVLDAARDLYAGIPSPESYLLWLLWGSYPTSDHACWSRQGALYFSPNAIWSDPADDLRHEQWAHAGLAAFVNAGIDNGTQFADANPGDRPAAGLDPAAAARLEELRSGWDPERRFVSYLRPDESTTALADSRR